MATHQLILKDYGTTPNFFTTFYKSTFKMKVKKPRKFQGVLGQKQFQP